MPTKLFLCHSSVDKGFVEDVARHFGRSRILFDKWSFEAGVDFRESIRTALDSTDHFIYFASRNSVSSNWCAFELDELEYRRLHGHITSITILTIDPTLDYNSLPSWMRRLRIVHVRGPRQACRELERRLVASDAQRESAPFVGRQLQSAEFVNSLGGTASQGIRLFIVSGLHGIGRRSYLQKELTSNIALPVGPVYIGDETHTAADLYLWLLDESDTQISQTDLKDEIVAFQHLSLDQQATEIAVRLVTLASTGTIPLLIDDGQFLDAKGRYSDVAHAFISDFIDNTSDGYLAIVHTRHPRLQEAAFATYALLQRIPELTSAESRVLLSQLLKQQGVPFDTSQLSQLAEAIAGYPPSASFATRLARDYGLSAVLADQSELVALRTRSFTRFVDRLPLSDTEEQVLLFLNSETILTFETLSVALDIVGPLLAPILTKLIDLSVVVATPDGKYRICEPLRDAIIRARGRVSIADYATIRDRLLGRLWADAERAPTIDAVDATLHAIASSNLGSVDFGPYSGYLRPSILAHAALESYRRQDWETVIAYAERCKDFGKLGREVQSVLFKSFVQLERWEEAEDELGIIRKQGHPFALYLEGFMLRKRRRYKEARRAFEAAMESGDSGYPVKRDLADCLYRCGEIAGAKKLIESLLSQKDSENPYVVDLYCRILLDSGDIPEAKIALDLLERCDFKRQFVHHRRARILAATERLSEALAAAEEAVNSGFVPFDSKALLIDLLIESGDTPRARVELLGLSEGKWKNFKKEIQSGLRVKLLTKEGKWKEAEDVLRRMESREEEIGRRMLLRILEIKAVDTDLAIIARQKVSREIDELKMEFGGKTRSAVMELLGDECDEGAPSE